MDVLISIRRTPPIAKAIGEASALLLNAANDEKKPPLSYEESLRRYAEDPESTLDMIGCCDIHALKNSTMHELLKITRQDPEIIEETMHRMKDSDEPWGPALADLGMGILDFISRCQCAKGRMPMIDQNILVAIDGSRLSYLALEVATQLLKNGRLILLHLESEESKTLPTDLQARFLIDDLNSRCQERLLIPSSHYTVIAHRMDSNQSEESIGECIREQMALHNAQVLILGCYGIAGPRVQSLGVNAAWAATSIAQATIITTPYVKPFLAASYHQSSHFMLVTTAVVVNGVLTRSSYNDDIRETMKLMCHWHELTVMIIITDSRGPRFNSAFKELRQNTLKHLTSIIDTAQVRGSIIVERLVPTERAMNEVVLDGCQACKADFLVLARDEECTRDCLRNSRVSVILLPTDQKSEEPQNASSGQKKPSRATSSNVLLTKIFTKQP